MASCYPTIKRLESSYPHKVENKVPSKVVLVADKDVPLSRKYSLKEGNSLIYRLPSGQDVALWVVQDKEGAGEQETKTGLQCWWGEKPFKYAPVNIIRDSSGGFTIRDISYIKRGAVITSTSGRTTERKLVVGSWDVSYIMNLDSSPDLEITVRITER